MDEAARAFGLALDRPVRDASIYVYPDHWTPMIVAQNMATQWHIGASGSPLGLRYEALPFVLATLEVPPADHGPVFADLRILESDMLALLRAKAH
jgi:hypothetical protein